MAVWCGPNLDLVVASSHFLEWGIKPSRVELDEYWFPLTTSCCIMHIISTTCSFRRVISWVFSSMREGPLVDISLAHDLVMIGSRCDGNGLFPFRNLFSLGSWKGKEWDGKEIRYIQKFDNVETQNKPKVSLCSCSLKMHLSFSKYWLGPLIGYLSWWVSIVIQN